MSRVDHGYFPFSFDSWDQADTDSFIFYDVEWIEAWGPFKQGERTESISIDEGVLKIINDDGLNILEVPFKAVPK